MRAESVQPNLSGFFSPFASANFTQNDSTLGEADHFWMKRYYDFNIRDWWQFAGKLRYVHLNPVKRGLCERPEDWEWSSFLHYATGIDGCVEIESEWVARKQEILPHSSQKQLNEPQTKLPSG